MEGKETKESKDTKESKESTEQKEGKEGKEEGVYAKDPELLMNEGPKKQIDELNDELVTDTLATINAQLEKATILIQPVGGHDSERECETKRGLLPDRD